MSAATAPAPTAAAAAADGKDSKAAAAAATNGTAPAAAPTPATYNYFAIGSMINNVSLSLRGIKPSESYPGVVHDWELKFMGEGGMGTIEEKKGSFLHGVLHVVSKSEMEQLDKMEGGYDHCDVTVALYDGTTRPAIAYTFKPDRRKVMLKHNPPSERYIDIIIKGCQFYGVKQSWIDFLKTVEVTPRKKVSEYKKLAEPADPTKVYTMAEVAVNTGCDGKPLWFVVNGKVLAFTADPTQPGPGMSYSWLKDNVAGKDATLVWARGLYEPLYPIATSVKEMVPDHRAMVEDMASGRMTASMTVIGYVKDYCKD